MAAVGLALSPLPHSSQMTEIDPNTAIDSDLDNPQQVPPPPVTGETPDYGAPAPDTSLDSDLATGDEQATGVPEDSTASTGIADPQAAAPSVDPGPPYKEDDLIGPAEGGFGQGAQGLASLVTRKGVGEGQGVCGRV